MNILGVVGGVGRDANVETEMLNWWVHGASATLISNGKYIGSATEERFTRIKNEGNYPSQSIDYLLNKANITKDQIDKVVYVQCVSYVDTNLREVGYVDNFFNKRFKNAELRYFNHHRAHAAACFYASGYDSSNVFTFDGAGDYIEPKNNNGVGGCHVATFSNVTDGGDRWMKLVSGWHRSVGNAGSTFWLGGFYTIMADRIWQMIHGDPEVMAARDTITGKVMGLSAYGNPDKASMYLLSPFSLCDVDPDAVPKIDYNKRIEASNNEAIERAIRDIVSNQEPQFSAADLAAWTQKVFEETLVCFFKAVPKPFLLDNLCIGGGCALNVLANSRLCELGIFKNVFVFPATGDEGLSFGAAMQCAKDHGIAVELPDNVATVGPSYDDSQVENVLKSNSQISFYRVPDSELYDITAQYLADNKVVAWHQGQSEYGPRALGNRSILANPCYDNKDMLNSKVKFREHWRPYAAMIIEECLHDWVDIPREKSEYMLFTGKVREDKRSVIPAVTHEDNTCRMQTVTPKLNEKAYNLLKAFESKTKIPVLLNTSFNTIPGEPIVETPYDAVKSFLYSNVDVLVINNFIVTKNGN